MANRKWSEISGLTPERRERIRREIQDEPLMLRLREVRQAREVTQQELAEAMNVEQPEISRLEQRTDLYLNTLRRYIEGLGGKLSLLIHFDDETELRIENISDLGESPGRKRPVGGTK